jgi:hypothetical protein
MSPNPFQLLMENVGQAINKTNSTLDKAGLKIKQVDLQVKTTASYDEKGGINFDPLIGSVNVDGNIEFKQTNTQTMNLSLVPAPPDHKLVAFDPVKIIDGDIDAISQAVLEVEQGKLMSGFKVSEAKVTVDFCLASDPSGSIKIVVVQFGGGVSKDNSNTATITIIPKG